MQQAGAYHHFQGTHPSAFDRIAMRGRNPGVDSEISVELQAGPGAASSARTALRPLERRLGREVLEDVRLLVSELVTNSIRHSDAGDGGAVGLEVGVSGGTLRVEVVDHGAGFDPQPRRADDRQDGGWGLYLVDQLADRWGVVKQPRTRVWFELDDVAS